MKQTGQYQQRKAGGTKFMTLALSPLQRAQLESLARSRRTTLSGWIRQAIAKAYVK